MREGSEIRTKKIIGSVVTVALAAYAALSALIFPARTAASVSAALELSVRAVVPSLFAFIAAMKIISPALAALFEKTKRPGRFFGVGAGGMCMIVSGLVSGFPTAAAVYSEMASIGAIDEDEGSSLMPFCSGAGAAFLIGAVGEKMFSSPSLGVRLYLCQTAAALTLVFLTRKRRRPSATGDIGKFRVTPSHAARAVAEGGAALVGITSFIVFFSVISDALAADLMLGGYADAVVRSALEISGGMAALSRIGGAGRYLLGFAAGFSGFSVFLQSHFASRGAAMGKYLSGKLMMSAVTGALFAATEIFGDAPAFFEMFGARAAVAKTVAAVTLASLAALLVVAVAVAFARRGRHKARK